MVTRGKSRCKFWNSLAILFLLSSILKGFDLNNGLARRSSEFRFCDDSSLFWPFFGTFSASFHRKIVTFSPSFPKNFSIDLPNDLDASEFLSECLAKEFEIPILFPKSKTLTKNRRKKSENLTKNEKHIQKSCQITNCFSFFLFPWNLPKVCQKTGQISAKKLPKSGEIGIRIHV